MRIIFVRFGEIPRTGRSKNYSTGQEEAGVSVYEAIERDGRIQIIVPSMTYGVHVTLSAFVGEQAHIVEGEVIGYGSDGEPLLRDCRVVGEAGPERFAGWDGGGAFGAREPYDAVYEHSE